MYVNFIINLKKFSKMETRKLSLQEMEMTEGGDAASAICNMTAGLIGGIWGAAISACSFGAAIPLGILVGAAISTAVSEAAC